MIFKFFVFVFITLCAVMLIRGNVINVFSRKVVEADLHRQENAGGPGYDSTEDDKIVMTGGIVFLGIIVLAVIEIFTTIAAFSIDIAPYRIPTAIMLLRYIIAIARVKSGTKYDLKTAEGRAYCREYVLDKLKRYTFKSMFINAVDLVYWSYIFYIAAAR